MIQQGVCCEKCYEGEGIGLSGPCWFGLAGFKFGWTWTGWFSNPDIAQCATEFLMDSNSGIALPVHEDNTHEKSK